MPPLRDDREWRILWHFLEQYSTSSQTRSHFFRHVKGRPHVLQFLVARSDFRFIDLHYLLHTNISQPVTYASAYLIWVRYF